MKKLPMVDTTAHDLNPGPHNHWTHRGQADWTHRGQADWTHRGQAGMSNVVLFSRVKLREQESAPRHK